MAQQVWPYLLYEDGEAAVEFITRAFGFREVDRTIGAAGGMHVELEAPSGGRVYLGQPPEGYRNPATVGRTSLVFVLVDGVDAHFERARDEGATILGELVDKPYGRFYRAADLEGHRWMFMRQAS